MDNYFLSKIGNTAVMVPNELKDFTLTTKESSQVSYYGVDMNTYSIYVQFKNNGKGYLYPNQPIDACKAIMEATSVGSWVYANLTKPKWLFELVDYSIQP